MDRTTRSVLGGALAACVGLTLGCQAPGAPRALFAMGAIGGDPAVAPQSAVPVPGTVAPEGAPPVELPAAVVAASGGSGGGARYPVAPRTTGELTVSFHGLLGAAAHRHLLATVADIDHVKVILTPAGAVPVTQDVTNAQLSAGVTSVTFSGLPAGPAKVTIYAFDVNGNVIGSSSQNLIVVSGVNTAVAISVTLNPSYSPAPGSVSTTITFQDGPSVPGVAPGTVLGVYTVGKKPEALAFDTGGNVLVANFGGDGFTKLSPAGAALGSVNIDPDNPVEPSAIQVGPLGNTWVTDYLRHQVWIYNPAGQPAVPLPKMPVGAYPSAIAFDATGSLWALNYLTKSVTRFGPGGIPIGAVAVGEYPIAVAFGPSGAAWVVNFKSCDVSVIDPLTNAVVATYPLDGSSEPSGIAIDAAGNAWITEKALDQVVKLDPTGLKLGTYGVGDAPVGIAIDDVGNAWVAASGANEVTRLSPDGILLGHHPVGLGPKAIRKDPAGFLWVANYLDDTVMKLQP